MVTQRVWLLAVAVLAVSVQVFSKKVKVCKDGLVPNRMLNGECSCGAYPGINCFSLNTTQPDLSTCWEKGFICMNIGSLVGNDSYNSFGVGRLPILPILVKYNVSSELQKREGILLSHCKNNKTISLFDGITCVDCSSPNPVGAVLLYLLLNSIPIVVLFTVVVFFNINLASGLGHSFLFFYQIAPLVITPLELNEPRARSILHTAAFVWDYYTGNAPWIDLIDVHSFPCPGKWSLYALKSAMCLRYFMILGLILLIICLINCHCCPAGRCGHIWSLCRRSTRHLRRRIIHKGTILSGFCSMLVIIQVGLYRVCRLLLSKSFVYYFPAATDDGYIDISDKREIAVSLLDGNIPYFSKAHMPYATFSFVILTVSLFFPLLLIYKPAIPLLFHKLTGKSLPTLSRFDGVFDVFQGVYKPRYKFFAGIYLLYTLVLWVASALTKVTLFQFVLMSLLILILAIHCLVQPFQKRFHNFIESLYLLNLLMITAILQIRNELKYGRLYLGYKEKLFVIFGFAAVIMLLVPIAAILACAVIKCCRYFYRKYKSDKQVEEETDRTLVPSLDLIYR